MKTSEQGIALIKYFEGFSPVPYRCPAGKMTIGYGHVIADTGKGQEAITEAQAERLLQEDLQRFEDAVVNCVTAPLKQNQFDALVCLAYNIGIGAFEHSTMVKLLNNNDYTRAAGQFGRWTYAGGKILAGLAKRRQAEKLLFLRN